MREKNRFLILLCVFIVFIFIFNFSSCSTKDERGEDSLEKITIYEDIESVQFKFPLIKDIKSVRYYWLAEPEDVRASGPSYIRFGGIIEVGDDFSKEILKNCKLVESNIKINTILTKFNHHYDLFYIEDFRGIYTTHSFSGDFYFNKENQIIYFDGEY